MPDQVQLRGGSANENDSFTGAQREVTVDTTNNTLRVHDGTTTGGHSLAQGTASTDADADTIIKRDEWGRAQVADPVDDADIANKGWVAEQIDDSVAVLQSATIVKTDTSSTTAAAWGTAIPGMSGQISLGDAFRKVRIRGNLNLGQSVAGNTIVRVVRDAGEAGETAVGVGDGAGSRAQATAHRRFSTSSERGMLSFEVTDAPGDTEEHSYEIQWIASATGYINRTHDDVNSFGPIGARTVSSMTLEEVA